MEKTFSGSEFDWDRFNVDKNWKKHKVKYIECEEIFFDKDIITLPDPTHSEKELRSIALGKTKSSRLLFVAFTERKGKIRVISARDMHKKERGIYNEKVKKSASS